MTDKIYMSWKMFDEDINEFIGYLTTHEFIKNTVIIALKRGGFATSVALSNKLNIPVSVVSFQTRDNGDTEPRFLEPELINSATKIIIPDDIYDTGMTVETLIKTLIMDFNIKIENIAGLFHYKTDAILNSSMKYYRCIRDTDHKWVVMPWE